MPGPISPDLEYSLRCYPRNAYRFQCADHGFLSHVMGIARLPLAKRLVVDLAELAVIFENLQCR